MYSHIYLKAAPTSPHRGQYVHFPRNCQRSQEDCRQLNCTVSENCVWHARTLGIEAQNLSKILSKSIKNRSKIDQKSILGGLGADLGGSWGSSWGVLRLKSPQRPQKAQKKYPQGLSFGGGFGAMLGSKIEKIASWTHAKRRSTWKSIFYRFRTLLDIHFGRFLRSFWRPKSIKNQLFY